jgi:1-acyl-sn-glycerol-3-phosphate acyltransferase
MPDVAEIVLDPRKTFTYRLCARLISVLSFVWFRPDVEGGENIPLEGPVIIAPIHRSNIDFALSLFISKRKIFFMAKDGLFKFKPLGWLLLRLGAFPVKRGTADRESMAIAESVLAQGQALLMFPEGTRLSGRDVLPLRDGAMFIAARTQARVVPVGIAGSDLAMGEGGKMIRPSKIYVVVGPAIEPPTAEGRVSRTAIGRKTEELRGKLQTVYDESLKRLN